MRRKQAPDRTVIHAREEILRFASEDEEREWWVTHDLAPELGVDVTEQQRALIQQLKAKYRYVPSQVGSNKATKELLQTCFSTTPNSPRQLICVYHHCTFGP